jgi:hypothetical protein
MSKGGFALLSLFLKIDRIHPFDPPAAEHSLFDIRYSLFRVSFSIRLAALPRRVNFSGQGGADT